MLVLWFLPGVPACHPKSIMAASCPSALTNWGEDYSMYSVQEAIEIQMIPHGSEEWISLPSFHVSFTHFSENKVRTLSYTHELEKSKGLNLKDGQFSSVSSVQSLSRVWLFATPWTTARQASLSITNSRSLATLTSIESVMPSNHLILCCPLLLLPSIFPSIRVFSNESALRIRGPKYWSFSLNVSPSNEKWAHTSFHFSISLYGKFLSLI